MRILVTGGAGFIASHIVDAYLSAGHEVTVADDFSSGRKQNLNSKARLATLDIRDPKISDLFQSSHFDVVNHHAAQIDVRKSMQNPSLDASINILGTLRLLDCCRTYHVKKFIFASSGGTIYGECTRPAVEEDPSRPESPYGFSKAAAETYIRFFGKVYQLPFTILRYANVYGPRQDPYGEAGVVAIFIGKLLGQEAFTIYGTGEQERDYVYVGDVATANVAALTQGDGGTFNIGTGTATSVNALYQHVASFDPAVRQPTFAPARGGELNRSVLNAALAGTTLGWKPSHTLQQGLAETLEFFRQQKISAKKH